MRDSVLHERLHYCDTNLPYCAISLLSLLLLVCLDPAGMCSIDPGEPGVVLHWTILASLDAQVKFAEKEDLGELGTVVKVRGSNILIYLGDGLELCATISTTVQV